MGKIYICLRYDDFGLKKEALDYDRQLVKMADETNAKITVSIVPRSENCKKNRELLFGSAFYRAVSSGKIELAVHGYKHRRNFAEKFLRVQGEFGKKPYIMQEHDIKDGLSRWKNDLKLPDTPVFVPPYNVYDRNTVKILSKNGFTIISDGIGCDSAFKSALSDSGIVRVPFTCGIEVSEEIAKSLFDADGEYIIVALFHHYNYPIEKVRELSKHFSDMENTEFITLSEISKKIDRDILSKTETAKNKYYKLD